MASTKDTFEPKTFAANTFASGVWRGTGVTIINYYVLETGRLPERSPHGRLPFRQVHGRLPGRS